MKLRPSSFPARFLADQVDPIRPESASATPAFGGGPLSGLPRTLAEEAPVLPNISAAA
jgi:hypothetical protein